MIDYYYLLEYNIFKSQGDETILYNFRWFQYGHIAGCGKPDGECEINWLWDQGIRAVVSLVSITPEAGNEILRLGMVWKTIFIKGYDVPSVEQIGEFFQFVDEQRRRGNPIVIHCIRGVGRTGIMGALELVRLGKQPEKALLEVGGVETSNQEQCVYDYAKSLDTKSRD